MKKNRRNRSAKLRNCVPILNAFLSSMAAALELSQKQSPIFLAIAHEPFSHRHLRRRNLVGRDRTKGNVIIGFDVKKSAS